MDASVVVVARGALDCRPEGRGQKLRWRKVGIWATERQAHLSQRILTSKTRKFLRVPTIPSHGLRPGKRLSRVAGYSTLLFLQAMSPLGDGREWPPNLDGVSGWLVALYPQGWL